MRKVLLPLLLVLPTALPGLALAQSGTVTMKINVVNPSQKEPQSVPVKVHLPKEVTPRHIKDAGGLQLEFDPEAGTYYVHGDVALEAGQSITKVVWMEDIWMFGEEQLLSYVNQAKDRAGQLTEPSAVQEAAGMVQRIEQHVQDILRRQEDTNGKPAERISAYREGLSTIAAILQELDALDRLKKTTPGRDGNGASAPAEGSAVVAASGNAPGGAPAGPAFSMATARRIMLGIIAFLGVLSAVFFLTWHRLLRVTLVREHQAVPLVPGDSTV
jgi:hypothetical protein